MPEKPIPDHDPLVHEVVCDVVRGVHGPADGVLCSGRFGMRLSDSVPGRLSSTNGSTATPRFSRRPSPRPLNPKKKLRTTPTT